MSMGRPSRRWHTTSHSLTIPPARSPEIGGSIHLKRRPSSRKLASSGWLFQPQASSLRNAQHWNARALGGRGYRWRAGIEGRIASLRRDYGWRICRYHGQDGMERWLGLGVIASNLRHLAQATV